MFAPRIRFTTWKAFKRMNAVDARPDCHEPPFVVAVVEEPVQHHDDERGNEDRGDREEQLTACHLQALSALLAVPDAPSSAVAAALPLEAGAGFADPGGWHSCLQTEHVGRRPDHVGPRLCSLAHMRSWKRCTQELDHLAREWSKAALCLLKL